MGFILKVSESCIIKLIEINTKVSIHIVINTHTDFDFLMILEDQSNFFKIFLIFFCSHEYIVSCIFA